MNIAQRDELAKLPISGGRQYRPFMTGNDDSETRQRATRRMTPAERQAAQLTARQERIERRDFEQGMSRAGIATFSHGRIVFHSNHRRAN
jgi:hypothetical protein